MEPRASHLHTFFLFPFSIDIAAVLEDHKDIWPKGRVWFEGLDRWVEAHGNGGDSSLSENLGRWRRNAYTRFDLASEAYDNMAAFHPFVRRVFFDVQDVACAGEDQESLINTYILPAPAAHRLFLEAEDIRGRKARIEVTALRLFLFANGIGILSIGVEERDLPVSEALWINKMMRKVFPANQRQIMEGRGPLRLAIILEGNGGARVLTEERFENAELRAYQPPLASTIQRLLYFADYARQEYAPVLDERMLVYSYMAVNGPALPEGPEKRRETEVLLSRYMYVDQYADDFRYYPEFVRKEMDRQVYRRWAHEGTYYGFTSYSNVALTVNRSDPSSEETSSIVHRMFGSRYYMIAIIALFYRSTLLDFSEQTALVSKRLYLDQADGSLTNESIRLVNKLRADFLHFSNYWLFEELANKEEEMDHFRLQHKIYRLGLMKSESDQEIEKLNTSLHEYYQMQSASAVNRLAISSMILGAGAVITGYFGMNFEREFGKYFFGPDGATPTFLHYSFIFFVTAFAVGALGLSLYIIAANWTDYRHILVPGKRLQQNEAHLSLRRSLPKSGEL